MVLKSSINHQTSKYKHDIEVILKNIPVDVILTNKELYDNLCKIGCRNYGKKYSCPPYSIPFEKLSYNYKYMLSIIFRIDTKSYPHIYNTIRMVNTIMKSKQRKFVDSLSISLERENHSHYILENGSCRMCKICNIQKGEKCKNIEKMRYSLEATGVDVNALIKEIMDIELQWYDKYDFPKYQIVVSGVLNNFSKILEFSYFENNFSNNISI